MMGGMVKKAALVILGEATLWGGAGLVDALGAPLPLWAWATVFAIGVGGLVVVYGIAPLLAKRSPRGAARTAIPSIWTARQERDDGYKFRTRYREIANIRDHCSLHMQSGLPAGPDFFAMIAELEDILWRLQIQHPIMRPDDPQYAMRWFNFLARLAPLARAGDVESARALLGIMEGAQ